MIALSAAHEAECNVEDLIAEYFNVFEYITDWGTGWFI